MKIAIIQFPGSNCERESMLAVKRAGMEPVEFLWNQSADRLSECDGFFIVGGFSYEDRSRAGILASLDPIMDVIQEEAEKGKPVLGICNGAQILAETGMVPGLKSNRVGMALATNRRVKEGHVLGTGYYNTWTNVQLTGPSDRCAFTRHLQPGQWMTIPIAHAEGRFMMPDDLLHELKANDQLVFRYCNGEGNTLPEFPVNPNGSVDNLAAVCNTSGNVMAMMPHPERSANGDPVFASMRDAILEDKNVSAASMTFEPPDVLLPSYVRRQNSWELLVDLIITDNEAVSVENALRHVGLSVTITRLTHWEVVTKSGPQDKLKEEIVSSGELFNSNKECPVTHTTTPDAVTLLVRYKDDVIGQHKREVLKNWFHIEGIREIKKGVIWTLTSGDNNMDEVMEMILDTHILFNPYSHDCFTYG